MDNAFLVCGLQAITHLNPNVQQFRQRHSPFLRHAVAQRLPLQQGHHDEGPAFVLSKLVNRADVDVIE